MLGVAGLATWIFVIYEGVHGRPDDAASGWLLVGPIVGFFPAMFVQITIQRVFPPKLQAHAEGNTWLKLN
jgi:hypothetical protein